MGSETTQREQMKQYQKVQLVAPPPSLSGLTAAFGLGVAAAAGGLVTSAIVLSQESDAQAPFTCALAGFVSFGVAHGIGLALTQGHVHATAERGVLALATVLILAGVILVAFAVYTVVHDAVLQTSTQSAEDEDALPAWAPGAWSELSPADSPHWHRGSMDSVAPWRYACTAFALLLVVICLALALLAIPQWKWTKQEPTVDYVEIK